MKLNQLRYVIEVVNRDLNISAAAESLYTSQPGVSKQIKLLEEELGIQIFARSGKHLTQLTPAGEAILPIATRILSDVKSIKAVAQEFASFKRGSLSIATTHTQARLALPHAVTKFREAFPDVSLHMHQGTPMQIAEMAVRGEVDFAIATEAIGLFEDLIMMPCYSWNRAVIIPPEHPLAATKQLTIEELAKYPIVTYVYGFTGRSKLDKAFNEKHLEPNVVFTATDSEVIKTYVRLGLGVGIMAKMAYEEDKDQDLVMFDASHLFEPSVTNIGFRKGMYLREYHYEFIRLFAEHLTKERVNDAAALKTRDERAALFAPILPDLPEH